MQWPHCTCISELNPGSDYLQLMYDYSQLCPYRYRFNYFGNRWYSSSVIQLSCLISIIALIKYARRWFGILTPWLDSTFEEGKYCLTGRITRKAFTVFARMLIKIVYFPPQKLMFAFFGPPGKIFDIRGLRRDGDSLTGSSTFGQGPPDRISV